jgi:hypothetical protein
LQFYNWGVTDLLPYLVISKKQALLHSVIRDNNITIMQLNLLKAIKSTHRNPISRVLHLMGLSLYIVGFSLLAGYYLGSLGISPIIGIILFPIAIGLFLIGHKIEGNLRAMTLIILLKYLRSKLGFR